MTRELVLRRVSDYMRTHYNRERPLDGQARVQAHRVRAPNTRVHVLRRRERGERGERGRFVGPFRCWEALTAGKTPEGLILWA